jgi:hypothetical protein
MDGNLLAVYDTSGDLIFYIDETGIPNLNGSPLSGVAAPTTVGAIAASGAAAIPTFNKDFFITKSSAGAAVTLADPTSGTHDGVHLRFIATTAQAHSVDNSAGSGFFSSGGSSKDVATFGGAIGDYLHIVAYQGKWYILDNLHITLG